MHICHIILSYIDDIKLVDKSSYDRWQNFLILVWQDAIIFPQGNKITFIRDTNKGLHF